MCGAPLAHRVPYAGDVVADLTFYLACPVRITRTERARMVSDEVRPGHVGDVDNLAKAVLDALNGLLYVDDKQVVELRSRKRYGLEPRTEVRLYRFT